MDLFNEMKNIFESANAEFIKKNTRLFASQVSERTLCGALMLNLFEVMKKTKYQNYYPDLEYNRNGDAIKTIKDEQEQRIEITCDLIVHSRGENSHQDNLIALEMKKSTRLETDKQKDRERLRSLTKDDIAGLYPVAGILPEDVCGYVLGIYYEIDFVQAQILIEYYYKGRKIETKTEKLFNL